MTETWQALAHLLGKRMKSHAFCDDHPERTPDPSCPYCQDRAAYVSYARAALAQARGDDRG